MKKYIQIFYRALTAVLVSGLAAELNGAVPNISDGFETNMPGQTFIPPVGGWGASSLSVIITNTPTHAGTNSVFVPHDAALTNAVNVSGTNSVWTDFWIQPFQGAAPDPSTNAASFDCYFDTNGYVVVATTSGWTTCSNDIWGGSVAPVTSGFVHLSVYQNLTSSNSVVFVNDQLVLQDLRFVGSVGSYSNFCTVNVDSNAWLDDVWIKPNYNPVLTRDRNGVDGSDALEVQTYGYAARTQYVGGVTGTPNYPTLQAALNAWRPRDTIFINAGFSTNENIVLSTNLTFYGAAFTEGSITVAAGVTVTFNQSVNVGTLNVTGTLNMANGTLLMCNAAQVNGGIVNVASGATFSNNTLVVTSTGVINFNANDSRFESSGAGVDMTGVFVISNTWNTVAIMGIPFSDTFAQYLAGTKISALGFRGWGANDNADSVVVTNSIGFTTFGGPRETSQSVFVPEGTMLSNRLSTAANQKIWTDFYITPKWGQEPVGSTNGATFSSYVNTNGYLVVATTNGWLTCSSDYTNGAVTVMDSNAFSRVTLCQDFTKREFAVFLNGVLLRQKLPFLSGGGTSYSSFRVDCSDGQVCLDDVLVTAVLPGALPTEARDISLYGDATLRGNVYSIR